MIAPQIVWFIFALICYCLINSLVLAALLVAGGVKTEGTNIIKDIFLKTCVSILTVITLSYAIVKIFYWMGWIMESVQSVCCSMGLDRISAQSVSDQVIFTFMVAVVQILLVRNFPQLSRLTFFIQVIVSNICAIITVGLFAIGWSL